MKIAIIGGGAAGMMCTATLLGDNFQGEILLFEKNSKLGQKVAITGGGRCNVTTGLRSTKDILSKYIRGSKFLSYAMKQFPPTKLVKRFAEHNVELKTEKDMRIFPVSNKSQDIIGVFEKIFKCHTELVEVGQLNSEGQPKKSIYRGYFNESVQKINKLNNGFNIRTDKKDYLVDKVVVATGGNAYKETGSSGDAYDWAEKLGHTITPLGPSLSSFLCKEEWIKKLSGLSFPDARIFFELNGERKNIEGALLCTHFGISGPLAFVLSAYLAHTKISNQKYVTIGLQVDKNKNFEFWNNEFLKIFPENPNKQVKTLLNEYLPKKFIENCLILLLPNLINPAHSLDKNDRKKLCHLLSGELKLELTERKKGDEFVTAGGVNTNEVNPKTMESLICPGLFFAGEVLNVDGVTGGFNLQAAWCMGRLVTINSLYLTSGSN